MADFWAVILHVASGACSAPVTTAGSGSSVRDGSEEGCRVGKQQRFGLVEPVVHGLGLVVAHEQPLDAYPLAGQEGRLPRWPELGLCFGDAAAEGRRDEGPGGPKCDCALE